MKQYYFGIRNEQDTLRKLSPEELISIGEYSDTEKQTLFQHWHTHLNLTLCT